MTINYAQPKDIPRLTRLWQESFGDSPESVAHFFRTGFVPENSAVADGGAGALYWFDCLWEGKRLAYIYAVATEKESRGKGICAALMAWTADSLRARGYAGAILVPAEEGLFRMYGKMGYVPLKKAVILREGEAGIEESPKQKGILRVAQDDKKDSAEEISAREYMALRKELLPEGGVEHTQRAFDYMAGFLRFYRFDGGIFCGEPAQPEEVLPGGPGERAMYLPLDGSDAVPAYFALKMG